MIYLQRSSGRVFLTRMGLRNIRINKTMSVASVLALISCLVLIGLVGLAAVNLNRMLDQFSSRNVIMVYLHQGTPEQERLSLQARVEALDNVQACLFISSDEAYAKVVAGQDYALLDGIDKDFMPEAFEVMPISMDGFDRTLAELNAMVIPTAAGGTEPVTGIKSVRHFQDVAKKLAALQNALTIAFFALIGLLLTVSVVIIAGTVRATMYSRQQEIKVMKSVGAAPAYIRWPFLVEGIALSVTGSLAALGLVFVLYLALTKALEPLLGSLLTGYEMAPFEQYLKYLLPGFLGIGLVTGGGGSMLSITRYLKEKVYEKSELENE